MTDNINPSHYKDGPFECIELSRLLSSDWGQAVQYCFRWQHKNGVEDLKKALWFINDAITHNVPFFAACCKRNADILEAQAIRLLGILQAENWADLEQFWRNLKWGDRVDVLEALTENRKGRQVIMEHIVQFAIGIDDETIQNRIEEHAYSDVLNKLTKNAVDSVFSHSSAYTRDIMWEGLMGEALQSFLEERKDEIIDKAANMLADRFQRTKKYREAMGAVIAKDGE